MSSMFFTKVAQKSVITTKPVPGGCQKCSLRPTKTREWHQLRPVSCWRRWIPQMYCHWRWDLNAYINPETKRQLIQWKHSSSPKPKKFKQAFLARRLRLLLVGTTKASTHGIPGLWNNSKFWSTFLIIWSVLSNFRKADEGDTKSPARSVVFWHRPASWWHTTT